MAKFSALPIALGAAALLLFTGSKKSRKKTSSEPQYDDWGNLDSVVAEGSFVSSMASQKTIPYRIYVLEDGSAFYFVVRDAEFCSIVSPDDPHQCVRGEYFVGKGWFDTPEAAAAAAEIHIGGPDAGPATDDWGNSDVFISESSSLNPAGVLTYYRIYQLADGQSYYFVVRNNESFCQNNPNLCPDGVVVLGPDWVSTPEEAVALAEEYISKDYS